ncbi:MAG TPA: glycosyltransferase family 4 protein [Thermomicrobiales bacterium]|nr:glycosyltransferase family 4 protein [Thermomicrobiales bacterium]
MNVVIAATQVPFVRGGAEVLVDGLAEALEGRGHRVAVVALPFKWYPKEQLLRTALAWRLLDLTEANGVPVDLVICTKFPTWAVRHPRKVAWLVHQHRQAYDWYGTPLSDFANTPADNEFRRRIRALDRVGLGECRRRFAISRNVAARLERFTGLDAEPLYPPLRLRGLASRGDDVTILSVSRLDAAKRLDLLVEALALTREPVRARLVGAGPEEGNLRRLIRERGLTDRVELLGALPDEEVVALYNTCRAVYYAPVDEDYGYVTVEALTAGKPVLTATDSGAVLEFVRDGVGGAVVPPEPAAFAAVLDRWYHAPDEARRLGEAGQPLVRDISWDGVVDALLGAGR